MTMPEYATLAIVAVTFLLAGTVKGVIGLGLPTVSLALLTIAFGLPKAMALLLLPSLVTNAMQALVGGNGLALLRRLWPFLICAAGLVWLGGLALSRVELVWLSALLGLLLTMYGAIALSGARMSLTPASEVWAGPLAGAINGILTGMTGSFVVPGVMYLQALGLPRDQLVQAMGLLFTVSTLALGISLNSGNFLDAPTASLSAAAVIPAVIGMWLGSRVRRRLSEPHFRRVFFAALIVLGTYIAASAMAGVL